jgi:hypothetical protein
MKKKSQVVSICNMQYAICNMQYAICNMQYAICNMQYAICNMRKFNQIIVPRIAKNMIFLVLFLLPFYVILQH